MTRDDALRGSPGRSTELASEIASSERRASHCEKTASANSHPHQPSIPKPALTKMRSDQRKSVARRLCARVLLSPRIVACPRSGNERAPVACICNDTDRSKITVNAIGRLDADGVPASQLACDLFERLHDFRRAAWRERLAAGIARETLQDARACVMIVSVEYRHGVDDGRRPPRPLQYLIEAVRTCVIATVADHDQGLAIARAVLEISERPIDGVVDGTHALCWSASQRHSQLITISGELDGRRQTRPDPLIEIDGEQLVERVTQCRESRSCSRDLLSFVSHAAAAVDHQPNGGREILAREELNRRAFTVVEHVEVLWTKTFDERAIAIHDRDRKSDQIGCNGEDRRPVGLLGRRKDARAPDTYERGEVPGGSHGIIPEETRPGDTGRQTVPRLR